MKLLTTILAILFAQSVFAAKLTINDWYRLNRTNSSDLTAEVCFTLEPAPTKPVFANIIVDKGTNTQGNYSAWIGPMGSTCHVVSTIRGQVTIEIPTFKLHTSKLIN